MVSEVQFVSSVFCFTSVLVVFVFMCCDSAHFIVCVLCCGFDV